MDDQRAQVVDPMGVVGMLVGEQHGVEPVHVGVEQLLAQVGRGVDQDAGHAVAVPLLHQQRAAAAAVLRILRIAGAPAERRPRHAGGRAAAQDGGGQRHAAAALGARDLAEQAEEILAGLAAISSRVTPRTSARTLAVSTT